MTLPRVRPASAVLPGVPLETVAARLPELRDPVFGAFELDVVQICPQHPLPLSRAGVEAIAEALPSSSLMIHASPAFERQSRRAWDCSNLLEDGGREWFLELASLCDALSMTRYSLHAGRRTSCPDLDDMFDNLLRVSDCLGFPVAVEHLYPAPGDPFLLSSWGELERAMRVGVPLVLDLSHIHILSAACGRRDDLVREILLSPLTLEVHVSSNNGFSDDHSPCDGSEWWLPLLRETSAIRTDMLIFSEGRLS